MERKGNAKTAVPIDIKFYDQKFICLIVVSSAQRRIIRYLTNFESNV